MDCITPQIFKDLINKSNGSAGFEFLKSVTRLVGIISEGKIPEIIRPFFFGAKLIALNKKDGGLRPIAVGNTLRRIISKCAGYSVSDKRKTDFGMKQVGCGMKRGAEVAAHLFRNLCETDNPKDHVILKLDFKNAFNSLNRETMLNSVFEKRRELYRYTHAAYSKPTYLQYDNSIIFSEEGTQQGDPEAPPLFADTIQPLIDELESKINVWYLDDGNLADQYKVVLKDLKKVISQENYLGLSLNTSKCEICFLGTPSASLMKSVHLQFAKICPGIKVTAKEDLIVLGAPLGTTSRTELMRSKIIELGRVTEIVDKLDAHYGFYLLKNCFSMPKLLYYLRTGACFTEPDLLIDYDKELRQGLTKVCNVNFTEISFTQATLPAKRGGLGIMSAQLLALPAFLASAVGAREVVEEILPTGCTDKTFNDALSKWFQITGATESPSSCVQKHWSQPVFTAVINDLVSKMNEKDVLRFNSFQDKFASSWLNVVPSKNLNLKLTDQQLRIAIGLRVGAKLCEKHKCVCGKMVEEDGHHGLLCNKSTGKFSRHANLNALVKQTISSLSFPSVLEPRGLFRSDGKRPDGMTIVPWNSGRQLVWDVTVVDSLATSRIQAGSVCNPGVTATDAEDRKVVKYQNLTDIGYIFQPLAFEVQGSMGSSTECFIYKLCKNLSVTNDEPKAGMFLKQRISLAIQAGNAACVLGTVSDKDAFDEIYYL